MKMAKERRPIDDLTPTTDVKLTSAPANLGMNMGFRDPKEFSKNPNPMNHALGMRAKGK